MHTFKLLSYHIMSFVVGSSIGYAAFPFINTDNSKIPEGTWMSFYHDTDLSLQINLSQAKFKNNTVKTWIREDRLQEFSGSSGLSGQTLVSKITINCDTFESAIEEQRAFEYGMIYKSTSLNDDTNLGEPKELMAAISAITLCGVPEESINPIKNKQVYFNI